MAKRRDFEEEMGSDYYKVDEAMSRMRGKNRKAKQSKQEMRSYDDDFDDMVSKSALKDELKELQKAFKKARSEDEKMAIMRKQTKIRAKLSEME